MAINSWMTPARLIRLGMGVGLAEVLANLGADVAPVVAGHGGSGGVEGLEEFGFELSFAGEVFDDEGLDVVAEGGVLLGSDLGLEVGSEVFR
jgi:hypothetical protein